jgi:hypothetical protein
MPKETGQPEITTQEANIRREFAFIAGKSVPFIAEVDYSPQAIEKRHGLGITATNPWDIVEQEVNRGITILPYTGEKIFPHSIVWTPGIKFDKYVVVDPKKVYLGK